MRNFQVEMKLIRDTKGTYVYAQVDNDKNLVERKNSQVPTLYIMRTAFLGTEVPIKITVKICK